MLKFLYALLMILSVGLVSCSGDDAPYVAPPIEAGTTAEQMLFVYIAGDNNLNKNVQSDLQELLSVASLVPADCYMLAFVDDYNMPRILRFFNNNGKGDYDTVKNFESEVATSDYEDMKMVFDWVTMNYPTKRLDLVLWSHGTGWVNDDNRSVVQRSFGADDNVAGSNKRRMYVDELARVLGGLAVKPDRLLFDACLMQCVEVAYALRNCANWIIASPAEIPADGAPYDRLMPLFFDSSAGVGDIIDAYVSAYDNTNMGVVLSAVRCDALDGLALATSSVVDRYFSKGGVDNYYGLFAYLPGGVFSSAKMPFFYDAGYLVWNYLPNDEYLVWKSALDRAVPYKSATEKYYSDIKKTYVYMASPWCGISMFLPKQGVNYNSLNRDFSMLEWYEDAGWKSAGW